MALCLCGCAGDTTKSKANQFQIDESDIYEVIRRDAYFYCLAHRVWPIGFDRFERFALPYRFGVYHGYYVCCMQPNGCGCHTHLHMSDIDFPVVFEDGLVFTLVECTNFSDYIAWRDHKIWVLADAYALGLVTREDMQSISALIEANPTAIHSDKEQGQ